VDWSEGEDLWYCEDGAGQQACLAAAPLHIYRLFVTWQLKGCQSRPPAVLKLLLRRDLSRSLKHSVVRQRSLRMLSIDNTKGYRAAYSLCRFRWPKALGDSFLNDISDRCVGRNLLLKHTSGVSVTKFVLHLRHFTCARCHSHGSVPARVLLDRASLTSLLSNGFY
jgi:hypothetical protein